MDQLIIEILVDQLLKRFCNKISRLRAWIHKIYNLENYVPQITYSHTVHKNESITENNTLCIMCMNST